MSHPLGRVRAVKVILEEDDGAFGHVTYVTVMPVRQGLLTDGSQEHNIIEAVGIAAARMISSVVRDAARERV